MRVGIAIDSKDVLTQLKELGQDRQGPFVLAKGLNTLAKKVQAALKGNLNSSLNLKRRQWVNNQVKIDSGTWATKTRLRVTIYMTDAAAFMGGFETGADHVPIAGRKFLAIPVKRVFGKNAIIGKDNPLRIANLNLHETPWGLRGELRTFVLHTEKGTPLIMQRVANETKGKGRRGVKRSTGLRALYTLIHASKRPMKIAWYSTAGATVSGEQVGVFSDVIKQAIKDTRR